jgi:hypothetical protein
LIVTIQPHTVLLSHILTHAPDILTLMTCREDRKVRSQPTYRVSHIRAQAPGAYRCLNSL